MATGVAVSLAGDSHRFLRKDGRRVEKRAVVLATVQAVADADAIGIAAGLETDLAAEAAAIELAHDVSVAAVGCIVRPNVSR